MWLSLVIALMRVESPLPPRRLALICVAIICLPGAARALGLLATRYWPGFLPKAARFTLIAGTAAAIVIEAGYAPGQVRASPTGSGDSSL